MVLLPPTSPLTFLKDSLWKLLSGEALWFCTNSMHPVPLQLLQEEAAFVPAELGPHFRQSTYPLLLAFLTHPSEACGLCALYTQ